MDDVGVVSRLPIGIVMTLLAAGCGAGRDTPFDIGAAQASMLDVVVGHTAAGALDVNLTAISGHKGVCYAVDPGLAITLNGVPATAASIHVPMGDGFMIGCGSSFLQIAFPPVPAADRLTIALSEDRDTAGVDVRRRAHPGLELVFITEAASTAGGAASSAELRVTDGDPADVPTGPFCWTAWLCPASDPHCASTSTSAVGINATAAASARGALLSLNIFDNVPRGDWSLWVISDGNGVCDNTSVLTVERCANLAACTASESNYGYLFGPFSYTVR